MTTAQTLGPSDRLARALAFAIPALLLGGAYIGQYGFGLYPCEMCMWQRWPHFAAIALALVSGFMAPRQLWIALAGLAILTSGMIGAFHAGVEYGWWEGITSCAIAVEGGGDPLEAVMGAPIIRCDKAPWDLFGISLAGWNFIISSAGAIAILSLLARKRKTA
ncbi:MAG: disulfide bond formation protein B [Alteripontixanthobacter sp.]